MGRQAIYCRKNLTKQEVKENGRALDNIWIERFWKSIKYNYIYLNPADASPRLICYNFTGMITPYFFIGCIFSGSHNMAMSLL